MFGLEGCGFVLSISVTFLLIGLVVYLFKKQLKSLEQKFIAIFQLSQTLATSVDTLRQNYTGGGTDPQHNSTDTRQDVVLSSDSESESESESDDEGKNQQTCPFPNVKIVDLDKEPLKEHMLNVFNFDNNEMNKVLDVTDLDHTNDDKSLCKTKDTSKNTDEDEDTDDETDEDTDDDTQTKLEPGSPNYKGMKVPDLRVLVRDKNIATDKNLKNLKKQELIDILKKNN